MRKDVYFIGLLIAIEAASFPLIAYLTGTNKTIVARWIVIDPLIMAYGFVLAIQWMVAIVASQQLHATISDNPRGVTWLTYLSGNMVLLSMTLTVAATQVHVQKALV